MKMPDGIVCFYELKHHGTAVEIKSIELIRCKHCKYYRPYTDSFGSVRRDGECTYARMTTDGEHYINCTEDEFCSYMEGES